MNHKSNTINRIKGLLQRDNQDDHCIIHNSKAYRPEDVDFKRGFLPKPEAKGIPSRNSVHEVYKIGSVTITF